jgi:hypothetical protein
MLKVVPKMVSVDTKNDPLADAKVEAVEMSGDSEVSIDNSRSSYKSVWGGNKVLVKASTIDMMRAWVSINESTEHLPIIGLNNLTQLIHIAASLSIVDDAEPSSLKTGKESTIVVAQIQALDRVMKNEIAAVELLLKERYDGEDVVLVERLSAHVQRGVDLLAEALKQLDLKEVTILDLLHVLAPTTFDAPIGITPAQNTLDEFI